MTVDWEHLTLWIKIKIKTVGLKKYRKSEREINYKKHNFGQQKMFVNLAKACLAKNI